MLLVSLHWHPEAPFADMLLRLDELIFTGADVLEIVRVAARQISQLTNNGQVRVNLTLPDLIAYLGWDSASGSRDDRCARG